jgi:hypothetical protein
MLYAFDMLAGEGDLRDQPLHKGALLAMNPR